MKTKNAQQLSFIYCLLGFLFALPLAAQDTPVDSLNQRVLADTIPPNPPEVPVFKPAVDPSKGEGTFQPAEKPETPESPENAETDTSDISEKIDQLQQIIKDLKDRINPDRDTSEVIGTLTMTKEVELYDCNGKTSEKVNITQVDLFIEDGVIKELRVHTKEKEIFENKIYISVTQFRRFRTNRIYNINSYKKCNTYIKLYDFLEYLWRTGYNYAPSNTSLKLDDKNLSENVTIKAGLNSYIDFRTYTDFLALIEEESNGLVQLEATARITGNTVNIRNMNLFLFNFIEPNFRYSKFDNDFTSIQLDSNDIVLDSLMVDRTQLNQLAKLSVGIRLNLFRYYFIRTGSYFGLNALANYQYSDIQVGEEESQTANLITFGVDVDYKLPRFKNFGLDLSLSYWWQKIAKNTGFDEELYKGIINAGGKHYFIPEFELYYYPLESENNKIFFRFRIFNSVTDQERNFNQIQVGYQTKIKLN